MEVKTMYTKNEAIKALSWYFGLTKTEARKQLKTTEPARVALIVECFIENARRNFYEGLNCGGGNA
jgi:hypothetical protein